MIIIHLKTFKLKDNFKEDDKKIPMGKTLLEMKYDEFYKAY